MTDTPNCDLLAARSDDRYLLLDFLEYLAQHPVHVACVVEGKIENRLAPDGKSALSLVHAFLGIDEKALEAERRALIASIQHK